MHIIENIVIYLNVRVNIIIELTKDIFLLNIGFSITFKTCSVLGV